MHQSSSISKTITTFALFALLALFGLVGYAYADSPHHITPQQIVPGRIVSVGGTLTEIVYALGSASQIVGTDTSSYFPREASQLPKVGYERSLSAEGVLSLTPDIILVTEDAGPPPVVRQLDSTKATLLKLKTSASLSDTYEIIATIGTAIHKKKEAKKLIAKIKQDHAILRKTIAKQLSDKNVSKKKVVFILSHSGGPPLVAGKNTPADTIISMAGASNAVDSYEGYRPLTPEALVAMSPDAILTTSHGARHGSQHGAQHGMQSHKDSTSTLLKIPGLALTPAGKNNVVITMDTLLVLGFGPRVIEAAMSLNRSLYH